MRLRNCLVFTGAILAPTLAATASIPVGGVRVRDAVGGVDQRKIEPGFYLEGTVGAPMGTPSDGYIRRFVTGVYDFEADAGSGFVPLRTYGYYPFAPIGFGLNPTDDAGLLFDQISLRDDASIPGQDGRSGIAPADQALLECLWFNAYSDSLTSRVKAAAFQVMIYEIVWDRKIDFHTGNVRLAMGDEFTNQVLDQLDVYAAGLRFTWTGRTPLTALTNDCSAPLLYPVPTPGSLALLMGAGTLMARRRRPRG